MFGTSGARYSAAELMPFISCSAAMLMVEREEVSAHGRYLCRDYCLMYMNALEAGDPDADIQI